MERGAATKGRVARAMAGADDIEIKATVPDHQIRSALRRFKLTADNDEERFIYFFDTPKLELLQAGIIARARRVPGDAHDSTVKFRPIDPKAVAPKWRRFPDFKIEVDASETGMVKSASFSMPVPRGHIKRVVGAKRPILSIFTPQQKAFVEKIAGHAIDFDRLAVLGPLLAQRWRFSDPGCPWPITAELWKRADGQRMMELSIKAPSVQAAAAVGGFMAFLAEVGAERDTKQQTKTRWALGYYAAKLPGAKAAPVAKAESAGRVRKAAGKPAGSRAPAQRNGPKRRAQPRAAKAARKAAPGKANATKSRPASRRGTAKRS